ncbi:MAG: response regulator, partial [Oxalobacteraceae bacterium]
MAEAAARLDGQCALLVEDDLLVAMGLKRSLEQLGAVVTWCSDVTTALDEINGLAAYDFAIVDINLGGEISAPVLDRLIDKAIYTVVSSGYDAGSLEQRFQHLPRCEKPFTRARMR